MTIITKGIFIRRDIDVLHELQRTASCQIAMSIPFVHDDDARAIEPVASSPTKRFETLRQLSEAGLDTAVAVAPIVPGLNDHQIPAILERARDCGARNAFKTLMRLPHEVRPVFESRHRRRRESPAPSAAGLTGPQFAAAVGETSSATSAETVI